MGGKNTKMCKKDDEENCRKTDEKKECKFKINVGINTYLKL